MQDAKLIVSLMREIMSEFGASLTFREATQEEKGDTRYETYIVTVKDRHGTPSQYCQDRDLAAVLRLIRNDLRASGGIC